MNSFPSAPAFFNPECVQSVLSAAPASPPGEGTLLVGAASRSVLPLVNGSYDYLKLPPPGRSDRTDPGSLREDLHRRYGGEVAFINGALGPGGAPGNFTERNFRRTALILEQLAAASTRLLESAEKLAAPRVSYRAQPFYTYLSNFGFRILLTVSPATGRTDLGHAVPMLYTCPMAGAKDDSTCEPDDMQSSTDPNIGVQFRNGDHLKSAVECLRIGPVGMMFLPGEIPGATQVNPSFPGWWEGYLPPGSLP